MCGIAGFAANSLPLNADDTVRNMMAAMARRGPDAEGIERWPTAVLGHRRLSIFDLSEAGRQPMLSPDRAIGLVFNGAIYNFLDIRRELEQLGYQLRSQCDTEVLVYGYLAWGIDKLVHKLRGMFAIAIWDERSRKLTLVRDRLGVKPLIYTPVAGGLAFASTVTALHAAGLVDSINPEAMLDYLEFGWIPDERAIYQNAFKVPAATIVEWHDGQRTERKYWSAPQPDASTSISFEDAVAATEESLLEAVRLRLFANVPVGALLSGGIDSTLVCWAMAKLKANITAFTISTPGEAGDEGDDARRTAQILGISHEVIELPASEQPPIGELVSAFGEPFSSASAMGMLRVSKAVKPKVTVLLTGDGGDDIFLGYPRHRHMWWAQRMAGILPGPAAGKWPVARRFIERWPQLRRPMHFMDYATEGLGAAAMDKEQMGYYQRRRMLGARLETASRSPALTKSFESARRVLPEFLEHEWRTQFTGEYMTKVDGSTMYYAVEARAPFVDHHLWEIAGALPYNVRLHRGELKAVLRQIVRNRIGDEVASRRKRGFSIPVEQRLTRDWKRELSELGGGSLLERDHWIQAGTLERAINDATAGGGQAPSQLWRLMVLEHWMRSCARQAIPACV